MLEFWLALYFFGMPFILLFAPMFIGIRWVRQRESESNIWFIGGILLILVGLIGGILSFRFWIGPTFLNIPLDQCALISEDAFLFAEWFVFQIQLSGVAWLYVIWGSLIIVLNWPRTPELATWYWQWGWFVMLFMPLGHYYSGVLYWLEFGEACL